MAHMTSFTETIVGDEPLSNPEKFLEPGAPNALRIIEAEADVQAHERHEYDARQEKAAATRVEIADNEMEDASNNRHPKPSAAVTKRCAKTREKLAEKLRVATAPSVYSGSATNVITDFIRTMNRPWRDAGTTQELLKGKTIEDMFVASHSLLAQGQIHLKRAQTAPAPRDGIERQIIASVDKVAERVPISQVRKPGGSVAWPMKRVFGGLDYQDSIDAAAILFDLFGDDIKRKLVARALDGFDDSESLTPLQRKDAIAAAEAEILHAERLSEFWYRKACEAGVSIGPRITSNPIAILDIVEA